MMKLNFLRLKYNICLQGQNRRNQPDKEFENKHEFSFLDPV